MTMDAPPLFQEQAAPDWGHWKPLGAQLAQGEQRPMPVKNTFVNVGPPPDELRRQKTTPGRLEGKKRRAEVGGEESSDSEDEEEEEASIAAPSSGEPMLMYAQPLELDWPSGPSWAGSHLAPTREPLDRLSTEALREGLLEGPSWAGSPLAPAREPLDWLSTEALREGLLEGLPAPCQGASQEPMKVGEGVLCFPIKAAPESAPPAPQPALAAGSREHTGMPIKNTFVNIAPDREDLFRLRTTPARLEMSKGGRDDDDDAASSSADGIAEAPRDTITSLGCMTSPHAPSRGALDRLSTESLQESFAEGAMVLGASQYPWQDVGAPCPMLPMLPAGGPAMGGLVAACAPLDMFTAPALAGLLPWGPPLTAPHWQDGPLDLGPSLHFMAPVMQDGTASGGSLLQFRAPASKLKTRDRSLVLDQFELPLGGDQVPFRVKITAKKVHDRKHGQCFQTARGRGQLELKCEGLPSETSKPVTFSFVVGSGCNAEVRGPVTHNFLSNSVAKLPADLQEWDFASFADEASMTVMVGIEVMPPPED